MEPKKQPPQAAGTEPSEQESGVQLSRKALYEKRLDEIAADRSAGRCTGDEARERLAQAVLALYARYLTPRGQEVALERVRGSIANNPDLQRILG